MGNRPPFRLLRELTLRVQNDGCIDVDTNHYSVPLGRLCRPLLRRRIAGRWRLICTGVSVLACGGEMRILHADAEVARHAERHGRRERSVIAAHLRGIALDAASFETADIKRLPCLVPAGALQRPLAEYEEAAGGGW